MEVCWGCVHVLHEALGLPKEKMIARIDVNEGRFLLAERCEEGFLVNMTLSLEARRMKANLIARESSLHNLRFRVLSYRGIERTIVQNLVCLMEEDTSNKITVTRGKTDPYSIF